MERYFSTGQSPQHAVAPMEEEEEEEEVVVSICEFSDFLRGTDEVFVLLSNYTTYVGRCLLVFWPKPICHTFKSLLKLEPTGCPETSANNQYTLRHIPKEGKASLRSFLQGLLYVPSSSANKPSINMAYKR
jgi:hypothetical protein